MNKKWYAQVMENELAYRLWQAPFQEQKLKPLFVHTDVARARRVLDVGCGPGTNTPHFAHTDYLGIDFNAGYIESARARHKREFTVADVTRYELEGEEPFDLILANSLLHHIDTPDTERILAHLATLLSGDGFVHIFDLVLGPKPSIPRFLALADRGDFARPLEDWRQLFTAAFEPVVLETYPLRGAGIALWDMVYFKGRARR